MEQMLKTICSINLGKRYLNGLMQIEKMNYEHELMEEGYEDIIKYGIAFYIKDCLIKSNKSSKCFKCHNIQNS